MTNKEDNIKSRLKLLINNIDEFDSKFVTYKAESMKELLENTLEYIKAKEQECEKWKHQAELGSDTTDRLAKELECKEQECESLKLRFEKLRQFNKKLIAENFEIGCRNIRYKNICNEIEKISTTAYSFKSIRHS